MKLKKETVTLAYLDFATRFGWPQHAKDNETRKAIVAIDHRELSKHYSDEQFKDALSIAWQQARRFPCIADFHRGFDAPEKSRTPSMDDLGL
jgi:hypothetical protein